MITASSFDVAQWIADNIYGGTRLTPEAIQAVAGFTVMWNLFEDLVCQNEANVRTFERIVADIDPTSLPSDCLNVIEECVAFWTFRYRTPQGLADLFLRLNFRRNDRQELVEDVLMGHTMDFRDKLLALLIIVYRLRNNLFHGLKTVERLNDQVHNLNTASRCLGLVLNLARSNHLSARSYL